MTTVSCTSGCCSTQQPSQDTEQLPWVTYQRLEVACRVAVGALSCSVAPLTFAASLAGGATLGLARYGWQHYTGEELASAGGRPVCAQGYSEMLSGRRLPERINLLVTALFVAMHTEHMPHFFVPFTGVFLGMWVSDVIANAIADGIATWQGRDATSDQYAVPSAAASCCH